LHPRLLPESAHPLQIGLRFLPRPPQSDDRGDNAGEHRQTDKRVDRQRAKTLDRGAISIDGTLADRQKPA